MLFVSGGCYSSSASAVNMYETTKNKSYETAITPILETTSAATSKTTSKPTTTKKTTKKSTKKSSKKSTKKTKKKKKKKSKKSTRVYWTEYGECYHRKQSCIRRSKYIYYGSVSAAISNGLRPCKKCC